MFCPISVFLTLTALIEPLEWHSDWVDAIHQLLGYVFFQYKLSKFISQFIIQLEYKSCHCIQGGILCIRQFCFILLFLYNNINIYQFTIQSIVKCTNSKRGYTINQALIFPLVFLSFSTNVKFKFISQFINFYLFHFPTGTVVKC